MTRTDNVEYHTGRKAFTDGLKMTDSPYLNTADTRANPDSRHNRWCRGYVEACDDFTFPPKD